MTISEMYPKIPVSDCFVNPLDSPFSRRGSYIAFANENHGEDLYGKCKLYMATCRVAGGMSGDLNTPNGFRQVKLEAVYNGRVLPCVLSATPYEISIVTMRGTIRFCIGERQLAMAVCDEELTLRITPTPKFWSHVSTDIGDSNGARLIDFRFSRLLLLPFEGTLTARQDCLDLSPDENGRIRLGFEEFFEDPVHRPVSEYPTYEQCLESVKADFDGFCARTAPSLPPPFEEKRLQALWQTWSMIVDPDGESAYEHTMVKMIHSIFEAAFVWQQPMQAVCLYRDRELSWEVFKSGFDHQDKNGRLMDALGPRIAPTDGLKPPIHGLCLLWLLEHGVFDDAPLEEKQDIWQKLENWTNYWRRFRDIDGDGVMEFRAMMETGWEDAPYYNMGFPCADPGLNAMLALQMEALSKFGEAIGKPKDITDEWLRLSEKLTKDTYTRFWNGENWFAENVKTGEKSDSVTVSLYVALILGKRLPQDIRDKTIALITGADGLDTPFGTASESPNSPYFAHGFTAGSVISPAQFLMALAFEACERTDLAEKLAKCHCAALSKHGFFHIYNALTGREDRTLTAFGERGLFWSAWSSSCYIWLADRYC